MGTWGPKIASNRVTCTFGQRMPKSIWSNLLRPHTSFSPQKVAEVGKSPYCRKILVKYYNLARSMHIFSRIDLQVQFLFVSRGSQKRNNRMIRTQSSFFKLQIWTKLIWRTLPNIYFKISSEDVLTMFYPHNFTYTETLFFLSHILEDKKHIRTTLLDRVFFWVLLMPQGSNHLLRMVSWNLSTLRFGGDSTPLAHHLRIWLDL